MFFSDQILLLLLIILTIFFGILTNYNTILKVYIGQIIIILLWFFFLKGKLFAEDFMLFFSFLLSTFVRLFFIPFVLNKFISNSKVPLTERNLVLGKFYNLIIYILTFILSYFLSIKIFGNLNLIFIGSFFIIISGFLNFLNHKKIIGDIFSFLEIENGVFLISILALGKINIYIELGIIIDIIMSLMILFISTIKIKHIHGSIDLEKLTELKE